MSGFTFQRPDQVWGVISLTYIPTGEGWLYLAIVKNLCTRKIVGYAFSEPVQDLWADRHAAGACGLGNGIPPPQASKRQYPTRSAAQCDVFAYLESFYNTRRPRSALGWIPPSRFEAELCHSVA